MNIKNNKYLRSESEDEDETDYAGEHIQKI